MGAVLDRAWLVSMWSFGEAPAPLAALSQCESSPLPADCAMKLRVPILRNQRLRCSGSTDLCDKYKYAWPRPPVLPLHLTPVDRFRCASLATPLCPPSPTAAQHPARIPSFSATDDPWNFCHRCTCNITTTAPSCRAPSFAPRNRQTVRRSLSQSVRLTSSRLALCPARCSRVLATETNGRFRTSSRLVHLQRSQRREKHALKTHQYALSRPPRASREHPLTMCHSHRVGILPS